MEQGLGINVQRLDWVFCIVALLCIIEGEEEGCLFYSIQRLLVLSTAEEHLTGLCPRCPNKVETKNMFKK